MKAVVRTCAYAISRDHGIQIVNVWLTWLLAIRMISLSVLFRAGSSSSYLKLFEFRAYANSLNNLDCSLAVIYSKKFILGSKILSPATQAVVGTCSCAISLHI